MTFLSSRLFQVEWKKEKKVAHMCEALGNDSGNFFIVELKFPFFVSFNSKSTDIKRRITCHDPRVVNQIGHVIASYCNKKTIREA